MSRKNSATRQYDVLTSIREYKEENGISPSIRDLMRLTGITSTSVIDYYLNLLEKEGLISRLSGISRGITLKGEVSLPSSRPHLIYRAYKMERDPFAYHKIRLDFLHRKVVA